MAIGISKPLRDRYRREYSATLSSTLQLRRRLLSLRPHLTPTINSLSDFQLSQLHAAIVTDHRAIAVQR